MTAEKNLLLEVLMQYTAAAAIAALTFVNRSYL